MDGMIRMLQRKMTADGGDETERASLYRAVLRRGGTVGEAMQEAYGFGGREVKDRETDSGTLRIVIDGELFHVTSIRKIGWGDLHEIETDEGEEFILSEDSDTAGQAARERWQEMAEHDPEEFACMVGSETLIKWGLGQPAGPGTTHVRSLSEWLDLWLDTPAEEFAGYDHQERTVQRVGKLCNELGFTPTVAYRSN